MVKCIIFEIWQRNKDTEHQLILEYSITIYIVLLIWLWFVKITKQNKEVNNSN